MVYLFKYRFTAVMILFSLISLPGCKKRNSSTPVTEAPSASFTASQMNRRLDRSVNLGNALEAPHEGDWGMVIQKAYLNSIASAGFTAVRIPVKWSAHASENSPYTVDPAFFDRMDEVVQWSLGAGLNVIIDFHHYDELVADPPAHKARWLAIWKQLSHHYKNAPDSVFFEVLNEPHDPFTAALWNQYLADAIPVIRQENPTRVLIVGPVSWNAFNQLPTLTLPDDTMLIVTFHYYLPFHFTHQGAGWVDGSDAWLGTTWTGSDEEQAGIRNDFGEVADWSKTHHRPIFLGEFGAYSRADSLSRIRWTSFIRETAEEMNFSWAYWEFGAGFGVYDRDKNRWRTGLLKALIPVKK